MRFFVHFSLLLACLALLARSPARADSQGRELRAFWADGFNEGYKTPPQIDTLLQRLHEAHCNAIFAQMRKGGDAYYASHYEPWATDDATHFDALACLIERAHRMQPPIAVHAWINTCAVGTGVKHPGFHVAQLHPEWLSANPSGNSNDDEVRKIDPGNPEAADWTFRLYLDVVRHYDVDGIHFDFVRYGGRKFGYNPASVTRFLRQLPHGYSLHYYQPTGVNALQLAARHLAGAPIPPQLPAPDDPAWKQWRRDQVTNLVRKVYAHAVQLNPRIIVSAATIAWGQGPHNEEEWQQKSAAMNLVFQDWRGWLQEGMLDLACPMTYFSGRHRLEYERVWSAWIKAHQYQRACAVAVGNYELTLPHTLEQMQIARSRDTAGHWPYGVMLYSYASTNLGQKPGRPGLHERQYQPEFYAMLGQPSPYASTPPFTADVLPPPMPWKRERGLIKGFVHTAALVPVDGALVTLEGLNATAKPTERHPVLRRAQRTDGTGFYAFVDVPAGTYQVRATAPRNAKPLDVNTQQVTLLAGQTATCHFRPAHFQAADDRVPDTDRVEILPDLQAVARLADAPAAQTVKSVRLDALTVVVGTDTDQTKGNLYVQDRQGFCLRVRLAAPPVMPFQPGDVIAVIGTPSRIDRIFRTAAGAPGGSEKMPQENRTENRNKNTNATDDNEWEPALDNATACLTDITLFSKSASVPSMSRPTLAPGLWKNGDFVQVRGRVNQSNTTYFMLQSEIRAKPGEKTGSLQVIVPIAGRKDFGVEATGFGNVPPAIDSLVAVTGLVTTPPTGEHADMSVWLVPRASTDIVLISPPPAAHIPRPATVAMLLVLPIVGFFLFLFYIRRRAGLRKSGD